MKRKYSIIKNHIGNDLYALVLTSWNLDGEGQQIELLNKMLSGITLEHCDFIEIRFKELDKSLPYSEAILAINKL